MFKMNVDFLEWNGMDFSIRGWVFHENEGIDQIEIVFESGAIQEKIIPVAKQYREDVGRVFQQENAYVSGFFWKGKLRISAKTQAFLVVAGKGETKKFLLQSLAANMDEVGNEILVRDVAKHISEMPISAGDVDARGAILVFDHLCKGGAAYYIQKRIKAILTLHKTCIVVRCYQVEVQKDIKEDQIRFQLLHYANGKEERYVFDQLEELEPFAAKLRIDEIWVNELMAYPDICKSIKYIVDLSREKKATLRYMVHDFFSVCPSTTLLGQDDRYCQLPKGSDCDSCFLEKSFSKKYNMPSVLQWRDMWKTLLRACDEILVFSEDSKKRMEAVFGVSLPLSLQPHKLEGIKAVRRRCRVKTGITIGILGTLNLAKGKLVIQDMLDIIKNEKRKVRIVLIGYTDAVGWETAYDQVLQVTGSYDQTHLAQYVAKYKIDVFFIPSICPETFSYTTEEAMLMGFPVVSFPIGAPPERLQNYAKGLVLDSMHAREALDRMLVFAERFKKKIGRFYIDV
ncbi:MAG: glycosyltransferase [Lachnospiraceae bacterium]|nr:glycosyltransferase [Lachnospiraceae bacterium]